MSGDKKFRRGLVRLGLNSAAGPARARPLSPPLKSSVIPAPCTEGRTGITDVATFAARKAESTVEDIQPLI
jgi:hypothetical protein